MLAERLEAIRQGADKRIPPDKRAIMHHATEDLRTSGIIGGRYQGRRSATAFRTQKCGRAEGALVRSSREGTTCSDGIPR